MRQLSCVLGRSLDKDCSGCGASSDCPYHFLYESRGELPAYASSLRPYIVSCTKGRDALHQEIRITLMGEAVMHAAVVWEAFKLSCSRGVGSKQQEYVIEKSWSDLPGGESFIIDSSEAFPIEKASVPLGCWVRCPLPVPKQVICRLTTPLRLRKDGRYLSRVDWPFLFSMLARRLEQVSVCFEQGEPLDKQQWQMVKGALPLAPKSVEKLYWQDLERYSSRQKRKHPLGGLMGEILFLAPDPGFVQGLLIASIIQVGKGASMGLGGLEVVFPAT